MTDHESDLMITSKRLGSFEKVYGALAVFIVSCAVAAPGQQTEAQPKTDKDLIEECKEKYPPRSSLITANDYFGVQAGLDAKVYPKPEYEREKSPMKVSIERFKDNQLHAHEVSPERSKKIEDHVNKFAAGMVNRANAGDNTYEFLQGGGGAFIDGRFISGPGGGLEPVADNYEGFGWLWRNVEDDDGEIVKQEISDNIYRYSDGTYYANPHPFSLSVADRNAVSTFEAPEGLGLAECASVPGNGATQGWRVSHFDFNHLYEPGYDTIQKQPWLYSNTTMEDVELADKRAFAFIQGRYSPGEE